MADLAGITMSEACDLKSPEEAVEYIINWCRHEAENIRERKGYPSSKDPDELEDLADRLQIALVGEQVPDYSKQYSLITCPKCGNDLTAPDSIVLNFGVSEADGYRLTCLDENGNLEDVEQLVEMGYHKGTQCAKCHTDLDKYEGIPEGK